MTFCPSRCSPWAWSASRTSCCRRWRSSCAPTAFPVRGIFLRNDVALREKEGLVQGKGWYPLPGETAPASAVTEITENGVRYLVDVENGQKTGFFLDQKYNRRAVGRLARGKTVLDCFTHTGSFALNAALGGAKHVTRCGCVRVRGGDGPGQRGAQRPLGDRGLRGRQRVRPAAGSGAGAGEVRLHHPGPAGLYQIPEDCGQRHFRLQGDQLPGHAAAAPGRVSGTCSCSHFATEEKFVAMLHSAAKDAGVQLRQIEARSSPATTPILWGVEETNYLKFYLFQVV